MAKKKPKRKELDKTEVIKLITAIITLIISLLKLIEALS